jgi:hypothetical protein
VLLPQVCGEARGEAGIDYSTHGPFDLCLYVMSKFRQLYPEYKDLSDRELANKLNADLSLPYVDLPSPWATLGMWASIAFGIPLAVLILGACLVWAFSGFAAKRLVNREGPK